MCFVISYTPKKRILEKYWEVNLDFGSKTIEEDFGPLTKEQIRHRYYFSGGKKCEVSINYHFVLTEFGKKIKDERGLYASKIIKDQLI